jgi:hypothetical protein
MHLMNVFLEGNNFVFMTFEVEKNWPPENRWELENICVRHFL